jgi:hypothetical protein
MTSTIATSLLGGYNLSNRRGGMDKVVAKLVALGVPGIVLLIAVATSGLAGGAAIVAALAFLGGPFGMLGGLALLGLLTLAADAVAKYGVETIMRKVVQGLVEQGTSRDEIRRRVQGYPISAGLKKSTLEHLH